MAGRPLRVGVVGTGALGRHHVRLLAAMSEVDLVGLYDLRSDVAATLAGEYETTAFEDLEALADQVEAMTIAVPTVEHAKIGCRLLERELHVLVEKPIASTLEEADRLLAAARGRVLAVGHVEFYNPAVQALLEARGTPRYVVVERLAPFSARSLDVDVVLDLMIHDLQIMHALDSSAVRDVRATGVSVLSPRVDIANARIELASGCVVNLTASRISAERVRQLRLFSTTRYYSLDYTAQSIKGFKLEAASADAVPGALGGRRIVADDLTIERAEPLRRELECFVAACGGCKTPLVSGEEGRQALATALRVAAAAAEASNRQSEDVLGRSHD